MDIEQYRYQKFISDLSGQDIKAHGTEIARVIQNVRDFLATSSRRKLPGAAYLTQRYTDFQTALPDICAQLTWTVDTLTFIDYVNCVTAWVEDNNI